VEQFAARAAYWRADSTCRIIGRLTLECWTFVPTARIGLVWWFYTPARRPDALRIDVLLARNGQAG
jgi:hypothetical protein